MPSPEGMLDPQQYTRALAGHASDVSVDPSIPVRRYFRSGSEMLRMAKMYMDDGQLDNAFILYTKYITLFLEKVPKHPEYNSVPMTEKTTMKKKLESVFPIAEKVKKAILEHYTKKYDAWLKEKEEEEQQRRMQVLEEQERLEEERRQRENFEVEKSWRLAQGREMLRQMEGNQDANSNTELDFNLPSVTPTCSPDISLFSERSTVSPSPSIDSSRSSLYSDISSVPSFDRSSKPRSLLSPRPDSSQVHGLRIVSVPTGAMHSFLRLAEPNTRQNVELCGILAGKMTHNQLVVTHVLIPKQSGTSDSCTTDNEEDIFMYQDKYDLITLGWIHTHPSQTAFMSSIDLHTHCSYQLMMPESIAIVCSPKYNETKIFSLTLDYGVDYISQCQQKGHHLHPQVPALYGESVHAKLDDHMSVTVVDLRK